MEFMTLEVRSCCLIQHSVNKWITNVQVFEVSRGHGKQPAPSLHCACTRWTGLGDFDTKGKKVATIP